MKQTRQIERDALYSRALKKMREPQAKANPNKLTKQFNKWLMQKTSEKRTNLLIYFYARGLVVKSD